MNFLFIIGEIVITALVTQSHVKSPDGWIIKGRNDMFLSKYETYISYSGPCKESSSPYSNINISINESASMCPSIKIIVQEEDICIKDLLSCKEKNNTVR